MYKIKVYSMWGKELKLERVLHLDTIPEVLVKAREFISVYLGFEKIKLSRIKKGRYNIFNNRNFVGELFLVDLSK